MPVVAHESPDQGCHTLALAIRRDEQRSRHSNDNLVVDHLDDEANVFHHGRPHLARPNAIRLAEVPPSLWKLVRPARLERARRSPVRFHTGLASVLSLLTEVLTEYETVRSPEQAEALEQLIDMLRADNGRLYRAAVRGSATAMTLS
jgi:hypothetical protein